MSVFLNNALFEAIGVISDVFWRRCGFGDTDRMLSKLACY